MEPISVMIVEDEWVISTYIASQLRTSGYAVNTIATSGDEALAHLSRSRPDLVLMDIHLKGKLDGVAAAITIRLDHRIPVIFLTAHADSETIAQAKHAEPYGYLVKPVRQASLFSAIEMAVCRHRSDVALMEREAWLSSVLQSTAASTIVLDTQGVVRFINPSAEELLQSQLSLVAGSNWAGVVPLFAQDRARLNDKLMVEISDRGKTRLPKGAVLCRQNGTELTVEGEISSGSSGGVCAGAILTIRAHSE